MRFRFRTLLIVVGLIAVVLAIVVPCYRRYAALRHLDEHRGGVYFEGNQSGYIDEPTLRNFLSRVDTISTSKELRDVDLRWIVRCLTDLREISFHSAELSRETAIAIGELPRLDEFGMGPNVKLDVEDLEGICRSSSLRTIDLLVPLDQAHFDVLGRNKALTKIRVHFTFVTEANLRTLIERPRLDGISFSFRGAVPRDAIEALLQRHPQVTLMCHSGDPEGEVWWNELKKRFPGARIIR